MAKKQPRKPRAKAITPPRPVPKAVNAWARSLRGKSPQSILKTPMPRDVARWFVEGLSGTILGDGGIVDGERGWQRVMGAKRIVDLDSISVETMIRVARYLYVANQFGQWLVDKPVEMAVGSSELGYEADFDWELLDKSPGFSGIKDDEEKRKEISSKVRGYLDPFWEHPLFPIRDRADALFTSYLADGSLCLQIVDHNKVTGTPMLDLIDAQQIPGDGVSPLAGRATIPGSVKVNEGTGTQAKVYTVVNVDPETLRYKPAPMPSQALTEAEGDQPGQPKLCFYFRRSKILNSMRGFSVLLAPADWIDGLDTFMWNSLDRAKLVNCLVYDIEMKGANEAQIKKKQDDLAKAPLYQPNTHHVHNENVQLKTVTADLKSYEATTLFRVAKTFIMGAKSFPEAWMGAGDETNRAALTEQADPTYRTLESYQKDAKGIFGTILDYAYDQVAERQKDIPPRVDAQGRILVWLTPTLPPISPKDPARLAATVTQLESGLKQAVDDAMLSEKTARRVFLGTVSQLSGVEVEPDEEMALIDAEKVERDKRQAVEDAKKAAQAYALARLNQKRDAAKGEPQDGMGEPGEGGEEGDEDEAGADARPGRGPGRVAAAARG